MELPVASQDRINNGKLIYAPSKPVGRDICSQYSLDNVWLACLQCNKFRWRILYAN